LVEMPRAAIEIGASDGIRPLLTFVSRQFSAADTQSPPEPCAFNADNAALSRYLYRPGLEQFLLRWIVAFPTQPQRNGGM
jgi:hypothetical protein